MSDDIPESALAAARHLETECPSPDCGDDEEGCEWCEGTKRYYMPSKTEVAHAMHEYAQAQNAEQQEMVAAMRDDKDLFVEMERELERWRHGQQIEGDYVCPNALDLHACHENIASLRTELERQKAHNALQQQSLHELHARLKTAREALTATSNLSRYAWTDTKNARELFERIHKASNEALAALPAAPRRRVEMLLAELPEVKGSVFASSKPAAPIHSAPLTAEELAALANLPTKASVLI